MKPGAKWEVIIHPDLASFGTDTDTDTDADTDTGRGAGSGGGGDAVAAAAAAAGGGSMATSGHNGYLRAVLELVEFMEVVDTTPARDGGVVKMETVEPSNCE
jgi:hypothetical protein